MSVYAIVSCQQRWNDVDKISMSRISRGGSVTEWFRRGEGGTSANFG